MKTCPNCGNQLADEVLFCNNCGTSVANVAADVPAADTNTAVKTTEEPAPVEAAPSETTSPVQAPQESIYEVPPVSPFQPEQNQPYMQQPFMNQQPQGQAPFMNQQQPFMNNQAGNFQQPYMQQRPQQFQQPKPMNQPKMPTFDPKDHTADFDAEDIKEHKLIAILPYFFFFLGVIACLLCKDSKYARFHMKNAIRLELASILCLVPCIIPLLGAIVSAILILIVAVVNIIAIVNAFKGKAKDLPIISDIKFLQ